MAKRYPEVGEFIIGTVKNIFKQGAFIELDEYSGARGMLPLSEISLKWVRNIRDYVKENQKVVLLVLNVNQQRGHIDLSLRRVSDSQRKKKLQEVKQAQRARKLLEYLGEELKVSAGEINEKITNELVKEYGDAYSGLEAIASDENNADKLKIPAKWRPKLLEIIRKSIKPPEVEITGLLKLQSYAPNGVDVIKQAIKQMENFKSNCSINVSYYSAPNYRVVCKGPDYKSVERAIEGSTDLALEYIKKSKGEGEFVRR